MKRFFDDFKDVDDVLCSFDAPDGAVTDSEIIYASYTYENYDGSACVIYVRDGKVYEVYGSHCSCYGLEGQWQPEEGSAQELIQRFLNPGWENGEELSAYLKKALRAAL